MLQSDAVITVTIDGFDWGTWSTLSGNESAAESSKHYPGGVLNKPLVRSGPAEESDLTLTRHFQDASMWTRAKGLKKRAGRARAVIIEQPIDGDGNDNGEAVTYTGPIVNVKLGDVDSSSSDWRLIEITVAPETVA